jgi:hypothetical protein
MEFKREKQKKVITIKNRTLMRKSNLVLIAAAAGMLASCSNEKLLSDNQDAQQVIGFTSYSESSTRGDVTDKKNLEYYHSTFAVYGTKVNKFDATKIKYVFGGEATTTSLNPAGTTCTYQTTSDAVLEDWKYTDPRFWDRQANYNFIAYAPVSENNPLRYYYSAAGKLVGAEGNEFKTTSPYVLQATNIQATPTIAEKVKGFTADAGKDLDLMISSSNHQSGDAHTNYVNLTFRHILSKLNITIAKSQALQNCTVTIKKVAITGLKDKGSYVGSNYDNTGDGVTSGWAASFSADPSTYTLLYESSTGQALNDGTIDNTKETTDPGYFTMGAPYFFIESLLMPQAIVDDQTKLTIDYTIQSGSYTEDYPYQIDLYDIDEKLRDIYEGYNYTINFVIDPDVIKFDAEVAAWDDESFDVTI